MLREVWAAINEGRNAEARAQLEADPALLASDAGQMALGYALVQDGLFAEARAVYAALRDAHAGQPGQHIFIHQLGMVERQAGEYRAAVVLFDLEQELIERLPAAERAFKRGINGYELGLCRLELGEIAEAREMLATALADAREADDPMTLGCVHRAQGECAARTGDLATAHSEYEQSEAAFLEAGDERAAAGVRARRDVP